VSANKLGAEQVLNAPVTNRSVEFGIGSKSFCGGEGPVRTWGTRNQEWHG